MSSFRSIVMSLFSSKFGSRSILYIFSFEQAPDSKEKEFLKFSHFGIGSVTQKRTIIRMCSNQHISFC